MATIVTNLGDITGAVGPFQIQGTVRRYPETRMLRRRQPDGGVPSVSQTLYRERFAQAGRVVRRWSAEVDPSLFAVFPFTGHGPNVLRSFALNSFSNMWWTWYATQAGANLFPSWTHQLYHTAGGPSRIWFRGTQWWLDPLITNASLTLVGLAWDLPPYDVPFTFAFTWPFVPPAWDHVEDVDVWTHYNQTMFVFTGTKNGHRVSSCLDYTILRSSG